MRIAVNLATRTFVELRPLFARLRLAMIVMALVAVGLGIGLHALNVRAKVATAQMSTLTAETASYEQERRTNETRMREPQNQRVLARSQFLNTLFAKKSFSWTAVMMDLEHVLPGGVQVTSIEPAVTKEGAVSMRLRVTGDRDKAIQLVRNPRILAALRQTPARRRNRAHRRRRPALSVAQFRPPASAT